VCRAVLAADFFEVDGRPTCAGCMKAQHPDFKCAGCGQILDGKYFRVGPDEAYHLACFVCSKCDDTIAGEFVKNGDKVLCVKCGTNMKKIKQEEVN
jgi:hypothetical protein